MKLSELGERGLIDLLAKKFHQLHAMPSPLSLAQGIGDDAAVVNINEKESLVFTTDMLVEDVDFRIENSSPHSVGFKSLAVNLSDLAAMGAKPVFVLTSIAASRETNVEWISGWSDGFSEIAKHYEVQVIGGDISKTSGPIVISVTAVGIAETKNIKYRSGAQIDDVICVTGALGDSAAGLTILEKKFSTQSDFAHRLVRRHSAPQARVQQGQWLSQYAEVHAMTDLSDGLSSDLLHLIEQSKVGAHIHFENLPVSEDFKQFAQSYPINVTELVVSGGEDFELLLTIDKTHFDSLAKAYLKIFDQPLFPIGHITRSPELVFFNGKDRVKLARAGFEHF